MKLEDSGLKWVYFTGVVIFVTVDLVSDWLVYADIKQTEKGLVYGPPGQAAEYALLCFSILGSVLFLLEILNLLKRIRYGTPWIELDLMSMLTIWLEDLPQISINVYISLCTENPTSYFQLTKASIVLFGLFARIVFVMINYYHRPEVCGMDQACKRRKVYRAFVSAGLFVNIALAICVFILSKTRPDPSGGLQFKMPVSFGDTYDEGRFFPNAGVFFHLPDFGAYPTTTVKNNASKQGSWIHLMSIGDVRNSDDPTHFRYAFQTTPTELRMAVWKRVDRPGSKGSWNLTECAKTSLQDDSLTLVNSTACQQSFITNPVNVYITLSFLQPEASIFRKRIFGDIRFNAKMVNNSSTVCQDYNISDNVDLVSDSPVLHYFRANAGQNATQSSHLALESGAPRFFRNNGTDMEDVATLWLTGFGNCPCSGNVGPTLRRDIHTGCD